MLARSREFELFQSKVRDSTIPRLLLLTNSGAVVVEPIDWSKATAAMQIFEGLKKDMAPGLSHDSPVDFLMVAGDGRDDEVIFRWANELERQKTVKNVTTCSLGSRNTEAGCTLTQGVTGMFRNNDMSSAC